MMLLYILSVVLLATGVAYDNVYIWSSNKPSHDWVEKLSEFPNFMDGISKVVGEYTTVNLYISDDSNCDASNEVNCLHQNPAAKSLLQEFESSDIKLFHFADPDELVTFIAERDHNFSLTQFHFNDKLVALKEHKSNIIILSDRITPKNANEKVENVSSLHALNFLLAVKKPLYSFLNQRADGPVVVPMKSKGLVDDGKFINFNECLYFYFYSAYVVYKGKNINLQPSMASLNGSSCSSTSSNLIITFSSVSPYKSVSTNFAFEPRKGSWACKTLTATFEETSGTTISVTYSCPTLTAHMGMSYMCNNLTFVEERTTATNPDYSVIGFIYVQAQPFVSPDSKQVFGAADSCIYFINIPIAMGFLIVIITILSALFGVLSLLSVKGMTRIENPKEFIDLGQTIK